MRLKKKLILGSLFCFASFITIGVMAQLHVSPIDTLLSRASTLYQKDAKAGILTAQKAYQLATKNQLPAKQIHALELLAYFTYSDKQFNNSYSYANSAIKIAKSARIDSLIGDALVTLGSIQSGNQHYEKALTSFQDALSYYKGPGMMEKIATAYLNMGVCERKLGRFERASKFYMSAAESYQKLNNKTSLAETYNAIGNCFTSAGDYVKSIFYHQLALKLRKNLKDESAIAQSCSNLGYVLRLARQPDSAINYLLTALAIRQKSPDSSRLTLTLQNLGAAWKMKNNLPLAKSFVNRSLKIAAVYNMEEDLARGNLDMAEILLAQTQVDAALSYANKASVVALKLQLPELLMNIHELKVRIYLEKKDYYSAFKSTNLKEQIKDSLLTIAKNKTIHELEITYQTAERKRNISELIKKNKLDQQISAKQQQLINLMTIAGSLLIILASVLFFTYRQKVKASNRVQILMQELHHRVKNNLQILSGLFVMQIDNLSDETAKAALRENESRLTSMNLIHHKLYQDNSTTSIQMQEYLTTLITHIKDSFGEAETNHIDLQLSIEPIKLEADKAVAVGLIVNELVTNSFKYAFKDRPGKIKLSLQLKEKNTALMILSDDGTGWKMFPEEKQHPSFGLKIVNLMVKQLDAKLESEHNGHTSYRLEIRV